jgi:protease-4
VQVLNMLRPPSVAVVDIQGMIGPTVRPLEFTRLIGRLREDPSVRGVVLNIDSPGGTAVGADMITRGVLRLREEKPVAGFVGGIGASGGYMIASAAQRVITLPAAIVGAIGVISYRPVVHEALDRIGVRMRVSKSGRLKDMLSPFREPTEEEQAKEQHVLDSLYEQFVASVADARGLPLEHVRELATGEVFTSADAIEHRLVDAIGDLDDAIDWVAAEAATPRRVRLVRPRRGLRQMLFSRASTALLEAALVDVEASLPAAGGYALYTGMRP